MSQQENTPKFIKQVPWYAQNQANTVTTPNISAGGNQNVLNNQLN